MESGSETPHTDEDGDDSYEEEESDPDEDTKMYTIERQWYYNFADGMGVYEHLDPVLDRQDRDETVEKKLKKSKIEPGDTFSIILDHNKFLVKVNDEKA